MRRNRPLADHYPLPPQQARPPRSNPEGDQKRAYDLLHQAPNARRQPKAVTNGHSSGDTVDMTRLSHPFASTISDRSSPQPRKPSLASSTPLATTSSPPPPPSAATNNHHVAQDSLGFHPPRSAGQPRARPPPEGVRPFYDDGSVLDPPLLKPAAVRPTVASTSVAHPSSLPRQSNYHRNGFQPSMVRSAGGKGDSGRGGSGGFRNKPAPKQFIIRQLPAATHVLAREEREEDSAAPAVASVPPSQWMQHQQPFTVPEGNTKRGSVISLEEAAPRHGAAPQPTPLVSVPRQWLVEDEKEKELPSTPTATATATATVPSSEGYYEEEVFGDDEAVGNSHIPSSTLLSFSWEGRGEKREPVPTKKRKDYGFMTPPVVKDKTAVDRPTDSNIPSYFAKHDVFARPESEQRATQGGETRQLKKVDINGSSIFWGFERHPATEPATSISSSASSFASSSLDPSSARRDADEEHPQQVHGHRPVTLSALHRTVQPREPPSPSKASAHPYEVARAAKPRTHSSLFTRCNVKESRVLQSYLAQHSLATHSSSNGNGNKSGKHVDKHARRKGRKAMAAKLEESAPRLAEPQEVSVLTEQDRQQLQRVVEAAERATAAAVAASEAVKEKAVTATASTAAHANSTPLPEVMADLIQSIINGKSAGVNKEEEKGKGSGGDNDNNQGKTRTEAALVQGPCATLIDNAGDPLVLNVVVDYLRKKAARLEGENSQLWSYLHGKGRGAALDTAASGSSAKARGRSEERRRKRERPPRRHVSEGQHAGEREQRQRHRRHRRHRDTASASAASDTTVATSPEDGDFPPSSSSSSGGTAISSITASTSSSGSSGKRRKAAMTKKSSHDHSIKKPKPKKVESIERTASRPLAGNSHANTTATTTSASHVGRSSLRTPTQHGSSNNNHNSNSVDLSERTYQTPERAPSTEHRTNTLLMSPSLSSSTTNTTAVAGDGPNDGSARNGSDSYSRHHFTFRGKGGEGDSPRYAASAPRRPPLSADELSRQRQKQRYSAEKDELYSFIHSLEEEEEAAIRAGRGSDYGFNDAPFYHYGDDDNDGAAAAGESQSRGRHADNGSNSAFDDSLRMGSSVTHIRFAIPTNRSEVGTSTDPRGNENDKFHNNNNSSLSWGDRERGASRRHQQVQTGDSGLVEEADRLTETESEYVNRWRHGQDARHAPLRMGGNARYHRGSTTTAASQTQSFYDRDSLGGDSGREGSTNLNSSRATVITLHTHRDYTRRTVQRLQAYVDRLEDTRQRLKEAVVVGGQEEEAPFQEAGRSGNTANSNNNSGVYGVPPLYPQRRGSSAHSRASTSPHSGRYTSRTTHRGSHFRAEYDDPEVDATLGDMDETDPLDVKFVIQDDGTGSVSKQVIVEDGGQAYGGGSSVLPASTIPASSARSTPTLNRWRALPAADASFGQEESPAHQPTPHAKRKSSPSTSSQQQQQQQQQQRGGGGDGDKGDARGTSVTSPAAAGGGRPATPITGAAAAVTVKSVTSIQAPQVQTTPERKRQGLGTSNDDDDVGRSSSPLTRENLNTLTSASSPSEEKREDGKPSGDRHQHPNSKDHPALKAFLDETVAHSSSHDAQQRTRKGKHENEGNINNGGGGEPAHELKDRPPSSPSHGASDTRDSLSGGVDAGAATTRRGPHRSRRSSGLASQGNTSAPSPLSASTSASQVSNTSGGSTRASSRFAIPATEKTQVQGQEEQGDRKNLDGPVPTLPAPPIDAERGSAEQQPDGLFSLDGLMASPNTRLVVSRHGIAGAGRQSLQLGSPPFPPFSRQGSSHSPLSPASPMFQSLVHRHNPSNVMGIDRDDDADMTEDGRVSLGSRQMSIAGIGGGKEGRGNGGSPLDVSEPTLSIYRDSGGSGRDTPAAANATALSNGSSTAELLSANLPEALQVRQQPWRRRQPDTASSEERQAASPTPSPPVPHPDGAGPAAVAATTSTAYHNRAESLAAARSVSSPLMDDSEEDTQQRFHAALSTSPMDDTEADELTSPP